MPGPKFAFLVVCVALPFVALLFEVDKLLAETGSLLIEGSINKSLASNFTWH